MLLSFGWEARVRGGNPNFIFFLNLNLDSIWRWLRSRWFYITNLLIQFAGYVNLYFISFYLGGLPERQAYTEKANKPNKHAHATFFLSPAKSYSFDILSSICSFPCESYSFHLPFAWKCQSFLSFFVDTLFCLHCTFFHLSSMIWATCKQVLLSNMDNSPRHETLAKSKYQGHICL